MIKRSEDGCARGEAGDGGPTAERAIFDGQLLHARLCTQKRDQRNER